MQRAFRATIVTTALAASLLMLAGCAQAAPAESAPASAQASETPSATPSPTPTPTPTAAPTPTVDPANPSSWLITFDGVGPLTFGGQIAEETADMTAFADTSNDVCPVKMFAMDGVPGIWVRPAADGAIELITLGAETFGTPVADVEAGSPKTEAGIGIGATLQQLEAAYPEVSETGTYGDLQTYYGISSDTGRWIVFTIRDGVVDAIGVSSEPILPSEYCG
ncbi:hypothetical protein [Cryobacterium cheniae]|nr:hypothetical protein [Cryobacterium cheniae]